MILLALMCLFTPLSAFPKCNVGEHLEINPGSTYCESDQPITPVVTGALEDMNFVANTLSYFPCRSTGKSS